MAAKKPLKMSDGTAVKTIEELREHFNLVDVLGYYSNGRLAKWLESRFYDDEAKKVEALDSKSKEFEKELCMILGVEYSEKEAEKIDLDDISKRNERREQLKKYTADDKILAFVDNVAFTQKELTVLLKKTDTLETDEDDNKVIYLCGDHFIIPGNIGDIIYKGVNNPEVEFDEKPVKAGIDFQDLEFNIDSYIASSPDYDDNYYAVFCRLFENNLMLGVKLLHIAAEKESAEARYALGCCYREGYGVEKDDKEAEKYFQQTPKKPAKKGKAKEMKRDYSLFMLSPSNWLECSLDSYKEYSLEPTNKYAVDEDEMKKAKEKIFLSKPAVIIKSDGIPERDLDVGSRDTHIASLADLCFCLWYKGQKQTQKAVTLIDYYDHDMYVSCYKVDDAGRIDKTHPFTIKYNRSRGNIVKDIEEKEKEFFSAIPKGGIERYRIFESEKFIDKKLDKKEMPFIGRLWKKLNYADELKAAIDFLYEHKLLG